MAEGDAAIRDTFEHDLLQAVRGAIGDADVEFVAGPTPLTGGFWARLATFRLADAPVEWSGPLVVRVMPDEQTAVKETVFQRAVAAQGYPTPRVLAAGSAADGIAGQGYIVMEHAPGRPLLPGLTGVRSLVQIPALARRLPETLADVLVRLHRLDPAPVAHDLEAAAAEKPVLSGMLEQLETTAAGLDRPDLASAAAWLTSRPPRHIDRMVICHGDMHPFNVLVAGDGRTTVLDWSTAVLAPPAYDVAFTSLLLGEPPLAMSGPLRRVIPLAGRALSHRFVSAYERAAGPVDHEAVGWCQAIVCLRALVEVASWLAEGTVADRTGHPWLVVGDSFAARLTDRTSVPIRPR